MIAAGMEMKRLGMIQRPMYVVPNHMLEQFSREFLQAYPGAKILVADKKYMEAKNRKAFAARIASDKWDGIIITHSGFGRIGMRAEAIKEFIEAQLEEVLEAWVEAKKTAGEKMDGKRSKDPTVKQIERKKKTLQKKLDKLLAKDRKDAGVTFEELGVDFLVVDEAHQFKNLDYMSRHANVKGIGVKGSQRAEDLFMKIRHLEKSRPGRTTVFATGTPMSRSMAEIYTMQRYLQMDLLKEYGIEKFDTWAATFGQIITQAELAPNGRDIKETTSFSKFVNVPELQALYSRIADSVTANDLDLPRPTLKGGKVQVVESELSDEEEGQVQDIIDQIGKLKGPAEKGKDNHLSLFTKGLQVSTDARLLDPSAPFNPNGKIAKLVANVADIYRNGKAPALAQIIFLDMGVPGSKAKSKVEAPVEYDEDGDPIEKIRSGLADQSDDDFEDVDSEVSEAEEMLVGKFNLYQDIIDRLVAQGIPRAEIATIYDAKNDDQKARLFRAVREGKVRILLGSSGKMGVGTNVQSLLTAMHHVDAPWNPADVVQRDGRIVRQGNQNKEVSIFRYITKRSFEAYRWQLLDRKAQFEAQFRAGARGMRDAEDIDSPLPEASELKAAASGDPRIMEYAVLTKEIRELEAAKRGHERSYLAAQQARTKTAADIATIEKNLVAYAQDRTLVKDLKGDKFRVRLDLPNAQGVLKERKEAGERIRDHIISSMKYNWSSTRERIELGEISGFKMVANALKASDGMTVSYQIEGATTYWQTGGVRNITAESDPVGIARQFESIVNGIVPLIEANEKILAARKEELARLEKQATPTPFPKALQLAEAKARHASLEAALKPAQKSEAPVAATPTEVTSTDAVEEMPAFARGLFAEQEPGDDGQPFAGQKEALYQMDQRQARLREALIREIRNVSGEAGTAGDGVGADREGGEAADRAPGSEGADRGSSERDAIGEVLRDPVRLADALDAFLSDELRREAVAARAAEQGFTVEAYHGTTSAAIDVPNAFIPGADFGFHVGVGTPKAANSRLGYPSTIPEWMSQFFKWMAGVPAQSKEQGNILPLRIRARNPLRLPDVVAVGNLAEWCDPVDMMALLNHPESQAPEALKRFVKGWLAQAKGQSRPAVRQSHAFSRAFAAELERLGYDAIVYKNHAEGYGSDSMMVWNPSQVRSASDFFHPDAAGAEGLRASDDYVEQDLADRLAKLLRQEGMDTDQEIYGFEELAAFRAFHGSPHNFDQFSLDQIGTGEGVQAFGRGLYFTASPNIAKHYQTVLSKQHTRQTEKAAAVVDGKIYSAVNAWDEVFEFLNLRHADNFTFTDKGAISLKPDASLNIPEASARELANEWRAKAESLANSDKVWDRKHSKYLLDKVAFLEDAAGKDVTFTEFTPRGVLYEVSVEANDDEFLRWDDSLKNQSAKVRAALKNSRVKTALGTDLWSFVKGLFDKDSKMPARGALAGKFVKSARDQEALRQALLDAGIKGIKYRNGITRGKFGAVDPSAYNYVVFDDSIVSVVRKDGQPVTEDEREFELAAMRAFHGSQFDFDKFQTSQINTGEGAQVFGYGLYFAESQKVAEFYRDSTADYNANVEWLGEQAPNDLQQEIIDQLSGFDVTRGKAPTVSDVRMDIIKIVRMLADFDDNGNMKRPSGRNGERYDRQMALLQETAKSGHLIKVNKPGRVYEVELDIDPEQMIDWDAPLSEQSPFVRGAIANLPGAASVLEVPGQFTGQSLLKSMEFRLGTRQAVTDAMKAAGIRGVRYLDQTSRAAGSGTRNFVVFDENDIKIVAKDGKPVTPEQRSGMLASLRQQKTPDRGNLTFSPDAMRVLQAVELDLERRIRRMLPSDIRVDLIRKKLFTKHGEMVGRFRPEKRVVELTLAYGPAETLRIAAHEAVHVLRDAFTPAEWKSLVSRARKLDVEQMMRESSVDFIVKYRQFYTEQARQFGLSREETREYVDSLVEEEIVARMFEEAFGPRKARYGEPIDALIQRLADILDALVQAFNGQGLSGASFVMRRVERGEIAKRMEPKPVDRRPPVTRRLETAEGDAVSKLWDVAALVGRSIDGLGFYSKLDEVLGEFRPTDNVTAATLAQRGVKSAEIQARGLGAMLADGKAVPVADLRAAAEQNKVQLREARYRAEKTNEQLDALEDEIIAAMMARYPSMSLRDLRGVVDGWRWEGVAREDGAETTRRAIAEMMPPEIRAKIDELRGSQAKAKWSSYSLDPSNPTYRETVIHLPSSERTVDLQTEKKLMRMRVERERAVAADDYDLVDSIDAQMEALDPEGRYGEILNMQDQADYRVSASPRDFQSGHFPEPNIVGHMMTSMTTHQGKSVYTIDQIQSDWGQAVRDSRDVDSGDVSRRIEALKNQIASVERPYAEKLTEVRAKYGIPASVADVMVPFRLREIEDGDDGLILNMLPSTKKKRVDAAADRAEINALASAPERERLTAELAQLEDRAARAQSDGKPPSNPLVNTTDQWVTTTLRRAITQAVQANAEYIAIPSGDTVLSYNPGDRNGMDEFYGKIVPKNLAKLLGTKGEIIETLDSPSGKKNLGKGFTLFPLAAEVKARVRREGLSMFAFADGTVVTNRAFDMPGYEATVETTNHEEGRTRVYRIAKAGNQVASMALAEREPDQWEVVGLRVNREHQGKGIARKLLNSVEDDIGSPTGSDGILTDAAYQRIKSDSPTRVANHVRGGREFDGMWLSPRAVELMREAATVASEGSDKFKAGEAARDREVLKGLEGTIPDQKYQAERLLGEMPALAGGSGQAQPRHLPQMGDLQRNDLDTPETSLSDLVGMVKEALGMEVRQGRLNPGMKAAMGRLGAKLYGQFNRRTGITRIAIPMDLPTLTHEAGHALEIHPQLGRYVEGLKQVYSAEILPLASPGADQASEGWAEFVRIWLIDPAKASQQAPALNAAFRNMLEQHEPNLLTALEAIQVAYTKLLAASPAGAVASRVQSSVLPTTAIGRRMDEVKKKGLKVAIKDWLYHITTGAVDEKHPLKVAVRFLMQEAQRNLGSTLQQGEQFFLKAANDPYKLARMMEHARVHATAILRYGVRLKGRTLPSGPSMQEVLATAFGGREKGQWNDEIAQLFGSYLVARRMNAEWERYHQGYLDNPPDHLIPEAVWGKAQTDLETAHPQFKQAARMLDRFNRAHLELKLQNGFITQDMFDELTSRVGYAPLNRVMDDEATTPMSAKGDNRRQLIYRFKGSTRDFINPIESIISDVYRTQQRIELNNVIRALDKLARAAGPNGGRIAERIPRFDTRVQELDLSTTMDRLKIETEKVMRQAISSGAIAQWDAGQIQDELDNLFDQNASETLFSAVETKSRRGERIVYLWEGGERVPIMLGTDQTGEDIFNIFASVGRLQETEAWFNGAVLFTQAFRAGVTKSPAYVVVNWFRDQIATWVLSRDFTPAWTGLKGMKNVVSVDEVAKRYEFFAGQMGGIDANIIDTMGRGRDAMQLRKSGFFASTGTWDTILRTMEISEAASRMGHMEAAYQRLLADGFSEEEAAMEAAYNAHDVMDFSMHGSRMVQAARLVAFLNAQIQGLYAGFRTIKGERDAVQNVRDAITPYVKATEGTPLSAAEKEALPVSVKFWVKLVAIGLVGLALKWLYWDDPEHEELSRSQMGATHWFFKINGTWWRAPKPFELAIFSNLFEQMFDRLAKDDPTAPQRFLRNIRETMLLSPEMQAFDAIKAMYGAWTGTLDQASGKMQYDRSKSDLPMRLKGLPPELQWDAYTSEFSKLMAHTFGVSAYSTDKFIRDTFANLGRDALTLGDAALPWINQRLGGALPGVAKSPRADKSFEDYIFISRITRRSARGAESTFQFWQEMSEDNGRYVTAAKGYDRYLKEFKSPRDAQRFLATLDDDRKAYALLEHHYREQDQDMHPLNRARQVISAMTGIRRQMAEGTLVKEATDKRGREVEKIVLAPSVQRVVNEILEDMAMREARNAQVILGKPGWRERAEMPTDGLMKELEAAAPEVAEELRWRLSHGRNKVYSYEGVKRTWPDVKRRLLTEEPGTSLGDLRGQAR